VSERLAHFPKCPSKTNRQEKDEVSVYDVLEKGLSDLMDMCDVVIDKFTIARDEFNANKMA